MSSGRPTTSGERRDARDKGVPAFRERLHKHEQASRRQAQQEGRERTPRSAQELDRIARNTARRHDQRHER